MTYIIILAIVAFTFWKSKPFIAGWLIALKNRNKKTELVDSELVYVPVTSSRVFHFDIEIDELGGGRASIKVLKSVEK